MIRKLMTLIALVAVLALAACAGGPAGGPGGGPAAADNSSNSAADSGSDAEGDSGLAPELSVYNWADYIDEQVLVDYEEEYGVDIIYDTYASNEDLLAKLQAGATGYDVIFPSDYMVSVMRDLGLLAEIDISTMSNIGNMDPQFMGAPFDPENQYCVPYQWGTTGIGYRAGYEFFEENPPTSWSFLFDPAMLEQYADGGINVLNDPRELTAAAAIYLGFDANTVDPAELDQMLALILAAKPYWKTFNSEDYPSSLLVPDEVVLSHSWSGSVAQAYYETYNEETKDGNWYYAIPEEGAVKWLDNICITAATERYDTAVHFINYLMEAEVAATITNYVYYASPNKAAAEFILPEILEDTSIYPPAEVQEKLVWLTEASDEGVRLYDELWTAVKASQ